MSEIIPLTVTLELPASEFLDHEGGLQVRCQKCRTWQAMSDYYSEQQGQLLPLVGNVTCTHASGCDWKETVRILEKNEPEAEGGTLTFNAEDSINMKDKF